VAEGVFPLHHAEERGSGAGETHPATPLLQSPRATTELSPTFRVVKVHFRAMQPMKKSGVAGSCLASATALQIKSQKDVRYNVDDTRANET
jgi:hypothetical protein